MGRYERKPLEFKQYPTVVKVVLKQPASAIKPTSIPPKSKEAQSLIAQVLMANNKLNPAQKASLQKAKELLNG